MRLFVGVTDSDWFEFLARRHASIGLDEVNFWQPSGSTSFRALSPGEPFLFKLHSPRNYIVGGGFFAHFSLAPLDLAWRAFEHANGAATLAEMRQRVIKYRRVAGDPNELFTIGCILLVDPFFVQQDEWSSCPADFARNIVRGKGYDATTGTGRDLWLQVQERLARSERARVAEAPGELQAPMWAIGKPGRRRLGQRTFQLLIHDNYERRCAVTREKTLPVLEAAHIRSVESGGQHYSSNGLLLRSDIHKLFDSGYVTVTPDYRFRVSRRLREDWKNGRVYYAMDGEPIWVPGSTDDRPAREFLDWHASSKFLG